MQNDIETQIQDSLKNDRIKLFYKDNKLKILCVFFIILIFPIIFQFYNLYNLKKNEQLISRYIQAETLMSTNERKSIELLNNLKNESNETVQLLSILKLTEYYIANGDKIKALEILKEKKNYNNELLNEINEIKRIIVEFDYINEKKIQNFFINNEEYFNLIKKKLIYDFYIKSNQLNKAKQFLN
ncbi:MAG: hypothetical protein MRY23_05280 [Pelagibacteraceae bacterium]|nr:hypothetical protein [Pelagibacteraceae bacterium]MCI5079007.1 hypothetical protein [Pelagibacteraceae bacterium]